MSNWLSSTWHHTHQASSSPPPGTSANLRNYTPSPLGRRPTAPQLHSGLSSMSSPNNSTTSLSGMAKQPQHQPLGYRKAISMPPPHWTKEPLTVLEGMLGTSVNRAADGPDEKELGKGEVVDGLNLQLPELDEAETLEFEEFSLGEFASRLESQEPQVEKSPEEYEQEKERFLDLHRSIKACDEVLKSVEAYLSSFQSDLGAVSAEIESLQNRSMTLNRKLDNRKLTEKLLGPVVEDIVIPPNDVRRLIEGDVNEAWVKALHETERRMKAIEAMDPEKIQAVREVKPELEKITHKIIERVRDFFVSRIKALRLPGANAQMIQQSAFIRYKDLFQFIVNHHDQLAEEIVQAYINTMRWYYLSNFQRYHKSLEKLKIHTMDSNDVLGHDQATKGPTINLLSSLKSSTPTTYDPFSIGRRISIVQNRTSPLIMASQADDDKSVHYMEFPFRNFHLALMENCSSEYAFLTDFLSHKNLSQIATIFHQIWDPTFTLGQNFVKSLVEPTFDSIGVLICVRLNQDATFEMQKRRIPPVESYLNATNMLLWPRFQIILSAHCESLRRLASSSATLSTASKSAAGKQQQQNTAPHPITQKFSTLLHALLALSTGSGDDEPVGNSLMRLRTDYEALMTRLSSAITEQWRRERFLGNNYSLVVTIIGDTDGKLAAEQKAHFDQLKNAFQEL
ncbi:Vps52-domain-containing protein [Ascodesmis nigricans]|uniref:Vps52-domain-containing protein n=1 Tax=Ascodesmis nigricans TaxID=341454 RepID=A0A4S2N6Q0_9PEZI|nr:Vps52-domain-containing protein [Ascodesmis nigricans]